MSVGVLRLGSVLFSASIFFDLPDHDLFYAPLKLKVNKILLAASGEDNDNNDGQTIKKRLNQCDFLHITVQ